MGNMKLEDANRIAEEALAAARRDGLKPMAIVILNEAGQLKLVVREDGATPLRTDIAHGKAAAAFGMGITTRTLLERANANPVFFGSLTSTSGGRFIAQTGAVVITGPDGTTLGAIGASGDTGDADEAICIEGVQAAGFKYR